MLHYGGIYLDLDNVRRLVPAPCLTRVPLARNLWLCSSACPTTDNSSSQGCLQSLEPLLYLPTWTTDGGRGALSNNILGSVPATAFWRLLTDSLIRYNYNYLFPYITISYASGQWFETAIWQTYHAGSAHGDNPLADSNRPLHRYVSLNAQVHH